MLEELAKRDKDWRKMAYQICGCKTTADDLVQDMYIKFANYDKELNDYYIFFALRSLFLDGIKKRKLEIVSSELENLSIKEDDYCKETDFLKELILKEVEALPYLEREMLKVTQEISQRELSRQTDIPLPTIKKTVLETKKYLRQWVEQKK